MVQDSTTYFIITFLASTQFRDFFCYDAMYEFNQKNIYIHTPHDSAVSSNFSDTCSRVSSRKTLTQCTVDLSVNEK